MKKNSIWEKLAAFLNGKGFYMALAVCVCAVALSGWYLVRTVITAGENASSAVSGEATVTVGGDTEEDVLPEQSASAAAETGTDGDAAETGVTDGVQTDGKLDAFAADDPENLQSAETGADAEQSADAETVAGADGSAASETLSGGESDGAAAAETGTDGDAVNNPVETVENLHQTMQYPVPGQVVTAFSSGTLTYNEVLGDWRTHNGVDLSAEVGETVTAASAGTVTAVEEDAVLGVTVTVDCGDGYETIYGNLAEETAVSVGDSLEAGDPIGTVGSTAAGELTEGESFLHFAVRKDGAYLEPTEFLAGDK